MNEKELRNLIKIARHAVEHEWDGFVKKHGDVPGKEHPHEKAVYLNSWLQHLCCHLNQQMSIPADERGWTFTLCTAAECFGLGTCRCVSHASISLMYNGEIILGGIDCL